MQLIEDIAKCPKGWSLTTVGAACNICDNLRVPLNVEQRQLMQGEFPYYGPTGVIDHLNEYRLEGTYALIGEDGDHFLKFWDWPMTQLVSGKFNVNNHAHIVQGKEVCLTEWFHLYFHHMCLRPVLKLQGVGRYKLTRQGLERLPIVVPPVDEQKKLVAIIGKWTEAVDILSKLIAAKVRFKQGLMQQLLTGQRRFGKNVSVPSTDRTSERMIALGLSATAIEVERGLNGKSFDEGIPKLGDCPRGWSTRKLKDLLTAVQRPIVLRPDKTYRLVTAKRYRAGIIPREELRGDQIKTRTQFETKSGDFLISRRQIVHGGCGLVPESLDGAIVSNEYSCLRVSDDLDPVFLEYLTNTRYMQQSFYQSSVGVTVEKMIFRIEHWLNYAIHLPLLAEQRRIVALLAAMDREIVALDRLEKTMREQKLGLMQKLLTGELRLGGIR